MDLENVTQAPFKSIATQVVAVSEPLRCEFCDVTLNNDLETTQHISGFDHRQKQLEFISKQDKYHNAFERKVPKDLDEMFRLLNIHTITDLRDLEDRGFFKINSESQVQIAQHLVKVIGKTWSIYEVTNSNMHPATKELLLERLNKTTSPKSSKSYASNSNCVPLSRNSASQQVSASCNVEAPSRPRLPSARVDCSPARGLRAVMASEEAEAIRVGTSVETIVTSRDPPDNNAPCPVTQVGGPRIRTVNSRAANTTKRNTNRQPSTKTNASLNNVRTTNPPMTDPRARKANRLSDSSRIRKTTDRSAGKQTRVIQTDRRARAESPRPRVVRPEDSNSPRNSQRQADQIRLSKKKPKHNEPSQPMMTIAKAPNYVPDPKSDYVPILAKVKVEPKDG